MAIITLTMTVPESLIIRMELNVVTMISRVHPWLNVESAGMELMPPPSPIVKIVQLNLEPRSRSVCSLAVGDLGSRLSTALSIKRSCSKFCVID